MKKYYKLLLLTLFLSFFIFINVETEETIIVQKSPRVQKEEILKDYVTEGLTIKEINLDSLVDDSIKTLLTEKDSTHGIYAFEIQGENQELVYLNGVDSTFSNIEFSIEKDTLIISSKIEVTTEGTPSKTLLLIEKIPESKIQSVKAKITELEPGTTTIYDF